MQAIVLAGVQASGKSSFYRDRFFRSHVRLSLDLLGTREREDVLLHGCLALGQPFVIDNTNPLATTRARYAALARSSGFRATLYWLVTSASDAIARNAARAPAERVPQRAIYGTLKKFQPPTADEGFDETFVVRLGADGFSVVSLGQAAM